MLHGHGLCQVFDNEGWYFCMQEAARMALQLQVLVYTSCILYIAECTKTALIGVHPLRKSGHYTNTDRLDSVCQSDYQTKDRYIGQCVS